MFGRQVEGKKLNPHFCLNTNLPVKHFIIWIFRPHLYIWLNVNSSSVLCYCFAKLNKMENVLLSFVFSFASALNCIGLWLHLQELCYFELIWLSNSIGRSFPPKQQCECVEGIQLYSCICLCGLPGPVLRKHAFISCCNVNVHLCLE